MPIKPAASHVRLQISPGAQATAAAATATTAAMPSTDPAGSTHAGELPSSMELDTEK